MNTVRLRAWIGTIVFLFVAPGVVAGLIPYLITGYRMRWPAAWVWPVAIVAGLVILAGVAVLLDAFVRFARADGTPAPPAPTAHLVVAGPYRYVRNPMYVAVLAIILGQALLFVLTYEEPTLTETYGDEYREYRKHVRGWIPRVTPYAADSADAPA